jgi:hypothetical protein
VNLRTTIIDAVAAGAVLRALDKKGGPRRVTKTAYGLGVYVRYNKELHGNQKPTNGIQNPHEKWIKTIQWVSKLVSEYYYCQKEHARLTGAGSRGSTHV